MTPADYQRHGWRVTPIQPGAKHPLNKHWNKPDAPAVADTYRGAVGLLHAYSGTCALDVDQLDKARAWLAQRGIDLDALRDALDAVGIDSGKPNRAKNIYGLSTPLPSVKVSDDAGAVIFELRCGTADGLSVQDVLPPSPHPDGGTYAWKLGPLAHWSVPPTVPADLRAIWESLLTRQAPAPAGGDTFENYVPPADITADQVRGMLNKLSANCSRDEWLATLAGLHHQFHGSEEGFEIALAWSETGGDKFKGVDDVRERWESFGRRKGKLTTLRSAMARAQALGWPNPATVKPATAVPSPGTVAPLKFRHLDNVDTAPLDEIVQGLGARRAVTVIAGLPNTGKSFALINMGLCVAAGERFMGRKVKQCPVVYIAAEAPASVEMRARMALARQFGGRRLPFYIISEPALLGDDQQHALAVERVIATCEAIAAAEGQPVGYVIVDTVAASLGNGPENGDGMTRLVQGGRQISERLNAALGLAHHPSKADESGLRGHGSLLGSADVVLTITSDDATGIRTMEVTKARDAATGVKFAFQLEVVELPERDSFGDIRTTCIVRQCLPPAAARPQPKGAVQKLTYPTLLDLMGVANQPVAFGAVIDAVETKMPRDPKKRDTRRQRVARALSDLAEGGLVKITNDTVVATNATSATNDDSLHSLQNPKRPATATNATYPLDTLHRCNATDGPADPPGSEEAARPATRPKANRGGRGGAL